MWPSTSRQKGLATEGTRVKVIAEKVLNPPRVDNIRIEVELPLACEERDRAGVDRAVHRCLIHNTLIESAEDRDRNSPPRPASSLQLSPPPPSATRPRPQRASTSPDSR